MSERSDAFSSNFIDSSSFDSDLSFETSSCSLSLKSRNSDSHGNHKNLAANKKASCFNFFGPVPELEEEPLSKDASSAANGRVFGGVSVESTKLDLKIDILEKNRASIKSPQSRLP